MPMNVDGTGSCDRCGQVEQSTSILLFVIVSDVTSTGAVEVRYYCRRNQCSNEIRDAGEGDAPVPQVADSGTPSDQLVSDGTVPTPDDNGDDEAA